MKMSSPALAAEAAAGMRAPIPAHANTLDH